MNKKVIIGLSVLALILAGGAYAMTNRSDKTDNTASSQSALSDEQAMAMEKKKAEEAAMVKEDAMKNEGDAMMIKGSFTDYDAAKLANAEKGDVILYFSAPWCPTCQEANKNFNATSAPDGLTLLKVDYDSSTDLKRQYGVTYQHTFVQVDKDGKQLKKWSGSTTYDQLKTEAI